MVAFATMKQYFTHGPRDDEVSDVIKGLIWMPLDARLYQRSSSYRQWAWMQGTQYTQYLMVELREEADEKSFLKISVMGGWRSYEDGLDALSNGIDVKIADYRTCKEALEAVCNKFVERFQKPSSQGNVKVFYDEGHALWSWKRPTSSSVCYNADRSAAYNSATCMSVLLVYGNGVVPDETRYFTSVERSDISNGRNPDISVSGGQFHFTASLIPIYRNQLPFTTIHSYVPATQVVLYEFVMVNDEPVYINLKKAENSLLSVPIHSYSVRIESLVPENRLFLRGKSDLYAKRSKTEVPFLGWELEACSNLSSVGSSASATAFKEQMPWLIMCKNDGSISPEGFETVSVPATLDFWQESNLSSALDSLRVAPHNMRSFEHSKCGFHVHVSRSALSVLDLQKLERFVHNPENNDFITKIAGRGAGQYQKYSPDLFNNRKRYNPEPRPASTRRYQSEGILYFAPTLDRVLELADGMISYLPQGTNLRRRMINFTSFLSDYVSYSSLDPIVNTNSRTFERYPGMAEYSTADIGPDLGRSRPVYLTEICRGRDNPSDPVEHENLLRFLIEEIVCPTRPIFSSIVKKFFPEWNLNTQGAPASSVPDPDASWKAGLRKSAAPYKRELSKAASQVVKGPVGKGVNQRYDALNTTNAKTVEFRMFKGTMNSTSIMRYLEFVDALVRFVANTSATNHGLHYSAFVSWLSQDAFNVARYEHLISFITENGFLDRKLIRRKVLPAVVSQDKDVTGVMATPAKGFKETTEAKPLGSFTLTPEELPAMTEDQAEEQYDVIGNEASGTTYEAEPCNCLDCRIARGEQD